MRTETLQYPIRLQRADLERLLPHRDEFLFVERLVVHDECRYEGELRWPSNLMSMRGHFPGCPVVPGALLIEGAAQLAGAGMFAGNPVARDGIAGTLGMLGAVRRCSFTDAVRADELVRMRVQGRQIGNGICQISTVAEAGGRQVATIEITLVQVPLEKIAGRFPVDALLAINPSVRPAPAAALA